ncbi:uncharacterized protein LOC129800979 [Phlebotomus papatasi]|uniref:uncharacterized protein LOC129800979 n=1 Tax=Phlebotomus papatasi TaxID=29031 RepID=UPI002483FE57|nr:uncharacterized protein LOC129800979 [Phlebotomus papatasi]
MKKSSYLLSLGFFLCLAIAAKEVSSYKILMVFPSFSASHLIVASGLLKGLAKMGHEVTMVSSFPQPKPLKNYRDVVLPLEDIDKDSMISEFVKSAGNQWDHFMKLPDMINKFYEVANRTMSNPEFKKIMQEESFDLLILGPMGNQFLCGLAHHFKCPWVIMSQVQPMLMTTQHVGNPVSVASTPQAALGYRAPMTFTQRLQNFLVTGVEVLVTKYFQYLDRTYYESIFSKYNFPSFDETARNVSLVLVNHHFSQGHLRANVPALVEIGGIHIEDETDPLPKDIQEFLDSATDGAIFFSFGSNVKSSLLPQEKINAIIKCFGQLKEKVIFKWENDDLPNKPENIMIGKWLPQRDILAHRNIKLFVSHGGLGSIAEAKYRGVPLIGVPFFGDQMGNVAVVAEEGWAYQLNFDDLTEETFSKALTEVLTNSKYGDIARKSAQLYKDRPQTALETANFWIEYVIRHKGAPHMRSHAVHLNFWQNNSIDVLAFIVVIIILVVKTLVLTTKFLCRRLKKKIFTQKYKQFHNQGQMIRIIVLCTFVTLLATQCHGAKILLAFPTPSRSHMIGVSALMKGLAARGHSVTVMSSFPQEKPIENYKDVVLKTDNAIQSVITEFAKNAGSQAGFFSRFSDIINMSLRAANNSFHEEAWQKVMREESFDLVVVGMFFNNFIIGLGDHFKCPVMGIFSGGVTEVINSMTGNPSAVASAPHFFLGKVKEMDFMTRVKTFLFNGFEKLMWQYVNYKEKQFYISNFPSPKYKSYEEMQKNMSLFFVNDHFSVGSPRPLVPAVVEVGGIHIKNKPDPLPQRIQEFIDGAEHGVVFFSLGSNVKSSFLPQEKLDAILKTFSKLKQRVLFKWETDSLPNQPENVMTQKWMPQSDILAHKNVRVFVAHGGLGGITEAKFHGVPIVGIPFFADQMTNLATASREGWAVVMQLDDLTEETFSRAIKEVLDNPSYKNVVQGISTLFRDRPQTALETAIYWTEYVIRHRGAPHLQSHAVHLNFFQQNSLDVIAFFAIVIFIIFKVCALALCFCCRKITKSKGSSSKKSKRE